ncbi:MAG TPA: helicase-associated domain-containing protein [Ktedonobacteraceae bacterium]|nr:helicase-associated domain-containing protein [Ktedonobacteraceae bacterium]
MKTLRQVFGNYSEEELEQLAQWWGVGDKPAEGWQHHMSSLAQALQSPVAARFAWEQLDADSRQVLHTALTLSAPDGVMRDVLYKLSTHISSEAFEQAVATLQQHLLLVDEQIIAKTGRAATIATLTRVKSPAEIITKLGVPKDMADVLLLVEREIYTQNLDRSALKLEQILASLHADAINLIGQRYGFTLYDYFSRIDTRARLVGQLVQPEVPVFAWEQFDAATRRLIKWLAEEGGMASMQAVREHTVYDNPTLARCIRALENYAIAFDTFVGQERRLFVPRELLKNLKKAVQQAEIVEESGPVGLVELDTPLALTHQPGPLALYDLTTIIGTMYQQNIEPTQAGYVPKRIANKMLPLLQIKPRVTSGYDGNENLTLDMLFNIASEMKLVKLSRPSSNAEKPRYIEGASLKEWPQGGTQGMVRILLENWQQSRHWIDIAGANFNPYSNDAFYLDYQSGRKTLVSYLQTCTPGRWYTFSSLLRTIKEQNPYALRHRYAYTGVTGIRNAKTILARWYQVEGEIFTGLVSSSMYEMGIVALGYDQSDPGQEKKPVNPIAFMVTDLGAAALSSSKDAPAQDDTQEQKRTLIVQPNNELMLLQPDWPTLYSLLPYAQLDQAGIVSRLTLSRNSFLRALAQGKNFEQIQGILQERSQKELPQNVLYNLADWVRSYKEVTFSQVYLIEIPSENLANEIVASGKLKSFGLRRLAPCVLAASNETNLQELRRAFEKDGIVVHILGDIVPRDKYGTTYGRYR